MAPDGDRLERREAGVRNGERRVGAVEKFDGGEQQVALTDIFEIVHLEVAARVGLVPRLASRIAVLYRRAILQVLTAATRCQHRPEIVEHVPVETQPLAGPQADGPDPHPGALRQQLTADAPVRVVPLLGQFVAKPLRPGGVIHVIGLLFQHRERHHASLGEPEPENRSKLFLTIGLSRVGNARPMHLVRAQRGRTPAVETPALRRAIVIGGSIGGLFAAVALRRRGWHVDVFERVQVELAGRGAGIVLQPSLRAGFAAIGLDRDVALGVTVRGRKTFDFEGGVIGETECPQTVTSWDRIYRLLRDVFPSADYHRGRTLVRLEQHERSVAAHFADGGIAEVALVVGADGLRSTVREQLLPQLLPLYAGYIAWRALVPERAFPPAIQRALFDSMAFCLPPDEQVLGYPIVGDDNAVEPGRRRYNFVWYRPADEHHELPRLLTDTSGVTHGGSIPPPLIRPEIIDRMRQAARTRLAAPFREVVRLAPHPFIQPIYDLESPRMAFGRVALVGDAAFVARPHVAAGVMKAGEDALALANALEQIDAVEPALRHFEGARLHIGQRIVERARHLGASLQAHRHTPEERRRAARHHTPEAVMAETAVVDFLDT